MLLSAIARPWRWRPLRRCLCVPLATGATPLSPSPTAGAMASHRRCSVVSWSQCDVNSFLSQKKRSKRGQSEHVSDVCSRSESNVFKHIILSAQGLWYRVTWWNTCILSVRKWHRWYCNAFNCSMLRGTMAWQYESNANYTDNIHSVLEVQDRKTLKTLCFRISELRVGFQRPVGQRCCAPRIARQARSASRQRKHFVTLEDDNIMMWW